MRACVFFVPLLLSCTHSGTEDGPTRQPLHLRGVPEDAIRHITSSDDSTVARYAREIGFVALRTFRKQIEENVATMTLEEYRIHEKEIAFSRLRLSGILMREYHYGGDLAKDRLDARLSFEEELAVARKRQEIAHLSRSAGLPPDKKMRRCERLLSWFQAMGDTIDACYCHSNLAYCLADLGRETEQRAHLRAALAGFSACGDWAMACQCLGELGYLHGKAGAVDSMLQCFSEALRLAHRSRIPDQAARMLGFFADYYSTLGKLGIAHELHRRAIDVCREYKGGFRMIVPVRNSMQFHADIGCWEVVEDLLKESALLHRLHGAVDHDSMSLARTRLAEARMLMGRGEVKKAESLFESIEPAFRGSYRRRMVYPDFLYHRARGLAMNGRYREAIPVLREGLLSETDLLEPMPARFAVRLAEAYLEMGRADEAGRYLALFDTLSRNVERKLRRELVTRDVVSTRIRMKLEGRNAALPELERALARFEETIGTMDPSAQAYLWVEESSDVRLLIHEMIGDDPIAGYGAELIWRDAYRTIGADSNLRFFETADLPRAARARACSAADRIAALGAVHCLYAPRGDRIARWTVSRSGIHHEFLPTSAAKLRRMIMDTHRALAGPRSRSEANPPAELAALLRTLARQLLPPEIASSGRTERYPLFLISVEGFMRLLPFETLNMADGGAYTPLIMNRDVAYLRFADAAADGAGEIPGLILVNRGVPDAPGGSRPIVPGLEWAAAEGRQLLSIDPGATMLENEKATKAALLALWERASYIYIASHFERPPEAPYLAIIPLAQSEAYPLLERGSIGIDDIRGADLGRCDIVILSGCSTRAPHIEQSTSGAGLGEAFLDAGAASVIETFWDVRDDDAHELMSSFIRIWKGEKRHPVAALCEAKRRALEGSARLRQPSQWASYAISLGDLAKPDGKD